MHQLLRRGLRCNITSNFLVIDSLIRTYKLINIASRACEDKEDFSLNTK